VLDKVGDAGFGIALMAAARFAPEANGGGLDVKFSIWLIFGCLI
jgi:hypothetical protein